MTPIAPRHDVGSLDDWRDDLAHVDVLRRIVAARPPAAFDATDLLRYETRRALTASLFDPRQTVDAFARAAGSGASAAVAQRRWRGGDDDGAVVLTLPGDLPRTLTVGDAGLTWPDWIFAFAAAAIARDAGALALLCTPASIDAGTLPPDVIDPFWAHYCAMLAAAAVEPAAVPELVATAELGLDEARIAEPALVAAVLRPMLAVARAAVGDDDAALDTALAAALDGHRRYYDTPERRRDWSGLLALQPLALAAVARDRGRSVSIASDYLPAALIAGSVTPAALATVRFEYGVLGIQSADEAHWFLDLEGFPRAGRSHDVLERDERLVARYRVDAGLGLPGSIVEFALDDADVPLALDGGQLVWLAELFAEDTGASHRAWLAEAVACVDAALARIPDGADAVPADTIVSVRGRAMYAAEPGRFRRARLNAYRDALHAVLDRTNATPSPPAESRATDARASAYASMAVIRDQVAPLLEAIARDRTGEIVRSLRPRDADYAKAFIGPAVEVAHRAYAAVWGAELDMAHPSSDQTALVCHVAPAGMLADDNELSREFPGGYRAIAPWLDPHRVWVRWKYVRPGTTTGLAYDGLVWCDDHWAWFPKPYRALSSLTD